jgi:hypothetical protein
MNLPEDIPDRASIDPEVFNASDAKIYSLVIAQPRKFESAFGNSTTVATVALVLWHRTASFSVLYQRDYAVSTIVTAPMVPK